MDVKEIRRLRLAELTSVRGAKAKLSRDAEISPSQISQWISGERNMAEDSARAIEEALKLPNRSMDRLEGHATTESRSGVVTSNSNTVNETSGMVYISTENGGRRMEFTRVQSYELWSGESEKEVRGMTVPTKWIEEDDVNAAGLVSIELPDDAQGPRRAKGDVVVANTEYGDTLKNDKLYAIRVGATYTLRLVAILGNGDIRLCCANPDYKHAEEQIKKDDVGNLDILGEYFSAAIR